ncbi:MAG: hypothetical protein J3K34DRAFT_424542, partial [Monoraphidium minutum]
MRHGWGGGPAGERCASAVRFAAGRAGRADGAGRRCARTEGRQGGGPRGRSAGSYVQGRATRAASPGTAARARGGAPNGAVHACGVGAHIACHGRPRQAKNGAGAAGAARAHGCRGAACYGRAGAAASYPRGAAAAAPEGASGRGRRRRGA